MKRSLTVIICLGLILGGCRRGRETQKGAPDVKSAPGSAQADAPAIDTAGEFDPIANPEAPGGGTYITWSGGFPKSLNMWLDYNTFTWEIMGYLFETLVMLHSTNNEPVGILAEEWTISEDGSTFTFRIHPKARWSDGAEVTAEDVQFYYDVMMDPKNLTSLFRVDLKRLGRPEVVDAKTIRIKAKEKHWNNFWSAASMVAFPKHIWKDVDFNKQNFEFPVVSGPYKIKEVQKNQFLLLQRRGDWWGRCRKYNQGKNNFETIKYKFMEDQNKVLEAFKKGDLDVYPVYLASQWIKQTDFEAVQKGWVVKQKVFNNKPQAHQGFAINLRREKFQDIRVRRALCYLINRKLMNEKLMYNQYYLLNSYYPDLYPNNINPDVPIIPFNPDTARALLKAAGWQVGSTGLLTKDGKNFEITFMTASPDMRHLNIYIEDLKKVGFKPSIEQLSPSTLSKRMDNHDFDMYWANWSAVRLRDPEAEWHSKTADQIATNNYPGVKDKIVDSLIDAQKTEMNIDKRNDILRRIDHRLNEIIPYVLLWNVDYARLLYWNRFGTPRFVLDKFNRDDYIGTYWWYDQPKDAALKKAMKAGSVLPKEPSEVRYQE